MKTYTRQIYAFESDRTLPPELVELRPVAELRAWLEHLWVYSCSRDKIADPPKVRAGKGLKLRGVRWSYYDPDKHLIVLTRYQRNRLTTLHELVHALGFGVKRAHDRTFVNEYFRILKLSGQPAWWVDEQREKYLLSQP